MKIEIKSRIDGSILFEGDFSSLAEAVIAAIKSRANLSGASLSGASLYAYASVGFKGHGPIGRTLTAVRHTKDSEVYLCCGCFRGPEKELRDYIAGGEAIYRASRALALDTVLMLLAQERGE